MSTMTEETPAPVETKPRKWTSTAGPIQTKKVDKAIRAISWESGTRNEITGIHGKPETQNEWCSTIIFGGGRADVSKALNDLGDLYDYTITRENYQDILDSASAMLEVIKANTPVIDKRVTPEQDAETTRLISDAQAKRAELNAKKEAEKQKHVAELRAKYPWADTSDKANYVRAAANMKTELLQEFPHTRFSVTSKDYSSVRVHWELGPTAKQVEEITGKYKNGHFDGMTDSHDYDHSAYGDAVSVVLGRATYVSESRDIPAQLREQVQRDLCELEGKPYVNGDSELLEVGNGLGYDKVSDYAYRVIGATEFKAGSTYNGVSHLEGSGDARLRWKINFTVGAIPEFPAQSAQTGDTTGIHWRRNESLGGIEIVFPKGKPTTEQISRMKGYRFQWKRGCNYWWARHDASRERFANEFCGSTPKAAFTPDATDTAYEDQCQQITGA